MPVVSDEDLRELRYLVAGRMLDEQAAIEEAHTAIGRCEELQLEDAMAIWRSALEEHEGCFVRWQALERRLLEAGS